MLGQILPLELDETQSETDFRASDSIPRGLDGALSTVPARTAPPYFGALSVDIAGPDKRMIQSSTVELGVSCPFDLIRPGARRMKEIHEGERGIGFQFPTVHSNVETQPHVPTRFVQGWTERIICFVGPPYSGPSHSSRRRLLC